MKILIKKLFNGKWEIDKQMTKDFKPRKRMLKTFSTGIRG